jgi:DnaJ-class molecular chaperone
MERRTFAEIAKSRNSAMRMPTHFLNKRSLRLRHVCGKCRGTGFVRFDMKASLLCKRCNGRGKRWQRG